MKSNMYNYRRAGMPTLESEGIYAFAQERYHELLREAEEHRLALRSLRPNRPASGRLTLQMIGQFFTRLLPGRFPYAHTHLRHAKKSF